MYIASNPRKQVQTLFSFSITNAKNVNKKLDQVSDVSFKAILKEMAKLAVDIESDIKRNVSRGFRSGKIYKKRNGKFHHASAPGEYPKTDTGNLVKNIRASKINENEYHVRSGASYSAKLEFGTSTIAPRPFMGKTLRKMNIPFRKDAIKILRNTHERIGRNGRV